MRERNGRSLELHILRQGEPLLSDLVDTKEVAPEVDRARILQVDVEEAIPLAGVNKLGELLGVLVEEVGKVDGEQIRLWDVPVQFCSGFERHDIAL